MKLTVLREQRYLMPNFDAEVIKVECTGFDSLNPDYDKPKRTCYYFLANNDTIVLTENFVAERM